jgi:hypothetical protein
MPENVNPSDIEPKDTHTSTVLRKLLEQAPTDHFTLDWLFGHLPERSFGVILLFLSLIAMLPVISLPAHTVVLILTFQAFLGYPKPSLPRRWMNRLLPSKHLFRLRYRAIPLLEKLEMIIRPRWSFFLGRTRYIAGLVIVALTLVAILLPLPFSNIPPSIITILIALAYIEHDGMLLFIAYALACIVVTAMLLMVWAVK